MCQGYPGVLKGVKRGHKHRRGIRGCEGYAGRMTDLESGGDVKMLLHVGAQHLTNCGRPQLASSLS